MKFHYFQNEEPEAGLEGGPSTTSRCKLHFQFFAFTLSLNQFGVSRIGYYVVAMYRDVYVSIALFVSKIQTTWWLQLRWIFGVYRISPYAIQDELTTATPHYRSHLNPSLPGLCFFRVKRWWCRPKWQHQPRCLFQLRLNLEWTEFFPVTNHPLLTTVSCSNLSKFSNFYFKQEMRINCPDCLSSSARHCPVRFHAQYFSPTIYVPQPLRPYTNGNQLDLPVLRW